MNVRKWKVVVHFNKGRTFTGFGDTRKQAIDFAFKDAENNRVDVNIPHIAETYAESVERLAKGIVKWTRNHYINAGANISVDCIKL